MDPSTFQVKSGSLVIRVDSSGNITGDGTGNFDASTGDFSVVFSSIPAAEIIASVDVSYTAGSIVTLGSNTNGLPFNYVIKRSWMGDSIIVQDPVSSMFIVGFSGSVWMTRRSTRLYGYSNWYKLASISRTAQAVEVSEDGNYAWIGTNNGRIYRIAGLSRC